FTPQNGIEMQQAEARALDIYYDHRGSVWALGAVHLLALAHKDNWTSVGNFGRETVELDTKTWRPLRDGKMPEIIVASRGLRPGFGTWLLQEYIDITPEILARDRMRVFSRRFGSSAGFDKNTAPKAAPGPQKAPKPLPGVRPGPGVPRAAGAPNPVNGANPMRGSGTPGANIGAGQRGVGAAN